MAAEACQTELLQTRIAGQLHEKQTSTSCDSGGNCDRSSSAAAAAEAEAAHKPPD